MLLRFSVENFLSFDSRVEFSMAASKITRMSDHTIPVGNKKVLKGGFLFGANASGKSNFIKAINFARNIIIQGISNTDLDKKYFRINSENYKRPGVFQFEFIINKSVYSYGFAISYVTKEIIDEWLYKLGKSEQCFFSRETDDNGNVTVSTDMKINDKEEKNIFSVYLNDIKNKSMKQTLLLSDIAKRSSEDSEFFSTFKDVFNWFEDIVIIFPNSKFTRLTKLLSNSSYNFQFKEFLSYFDTGIIDVSNKKMEFEKIFSEFPEDDEEELRIKISNMLNSSSNNSITMRSGKTFINLQKDDTGNIIAQKAVFNHGNPSDLFDSKDESDGTQRLFDLIPLFFKKVQVILVDEIDRSLHSKLTIEFIKLFYKLSENESIQMIATTHDSSIMDLDLVRQDEIWFVERKDDHSSEIYSLNRFKERYDKKAGKDYLLGRYGAVPVFSTFINKEIMKGKC